MSEQQTLGRQDITIEKLLAREQIREVMCQYARGVDRRDWNLVASAYHPDGYDDHGGYKGGIPGLLTWLKTRHATIEQSMHFLGNSMIEFKGEDVAVVETYCVVYQRYGIEAMETIKLWLGDEALAPGAKVMAELPCRYVDRFECRDGQWRVARRTVVIEEVKANQGPDRLRPDWALAKRDRSDALWLAMEEG